jgi:hypothetical protein
MSQDIKKINGVYMGSQELSTTRFATDANLQGFWRGEDVNDLSPNGYTLTNNNSVTFTAGKWGNAFTLNGSNQYLSIADANCANLEISGSCTALVWFKPIANGGRLMCKGKISSEGTRKFDFFFNGNTIAVVHKGITDIITNTATISTGVWSFATFIYDNTNSLIKLIVNGVKTEVSGSGTGSDSNAPFTIGCDTFGAGDTPADFFNGQIANVAILNRAITDDDYNSLYVTGVKKFNGVDNSKLIIDSYPEANANRGIAVYGTQNGTGNSFACDTNGYSIYSSKFYIRKGGSPTGSVVSKLYAVSGTYGTDNIPTGSALATSNNFDISTLTTSYQLIEFTFSTGYTLVSGTKYFISIEYSGGDGSNFLDSSFDDSPGHGGNRAYLNGGSWTAVSAQDDIFYVYGTGTNIKKVNGVSNV